MSTSVVSSSQLIGLSAEKIAIEVDISNGLHSFSIIGLGDRSVDEARDRVSAAIKNTGYVSPKQKNQKIVVSLAPADLRKEGPNFDLGIAISYLVASGEITDSEAISSVLFLGELSLDGDLRKITGALTILSQAQNMGFSTAIVPFENIKEASLVKNIEIYPAHNLNDVIEHIQGDKKLKSITEIDCLPNKSFYKQSVTSRRQWPKSQLFMEDIKGNESAKRALEIAAAGAHNVLMYGPPGTGKTLLANAFRTILPPLSYEHSLEVTSIHSAAKTLGEDLIEFPPFRSPHHTASYASIVGGGPIPQPGEITLAHRGVLFLDECAEFERRVIESLRQPLEERSITVSRSRNTITFPAQFILIASMNPCPCGRDRNRGCICSDRVRAQYWSKISGPVMDRIDLWVNVDKVDYDKLSSNVIESGESAEMTTRVMQARERQAQRRIEKNLSSNINSGLTAKETRECINIEESSLRLLTESAKTLELSARSFHRIIRVAQTICDLENTEKIEDKHILEALQYRKVRNL